MSEFDFKCPSCGKTLSIDAAHQGKKASCPSCGAAIFIPPKPEDEALRPKLVETPPAASGQSMAAGTWTPITPSGDPQNQDEKDIFRIRPTLKAHLGQIILAVMVPLVDVAAVVLLKIKDSLSQVIIGAGFSAGLIFFLAALYKKHSILYRLSTQRFFVYRGLVSRKIEELELFRVRDIQVTQSVCERILKFGKMTVFSTDQTSPKFEMKGIRDPLKIKDLVRINYRLARQRERVRPTEFISDFDPDEAAAKDPSN